MLLLLFNNINKLYGPGESPKNQGGQPLGYGGEGHMTLA